MAGTSSMAAQIFKSNMKGYAEKKLRALDSDVLAELAGLCALPGQPVATEPDDIVRCILKRKKNWQTIPNNSSHVTPGQEHSVPSPCRALSPAPPASAHNLSPSQSPETVEETDDLFVEGHTLRIAAFNTLKLRVDRPELEQHWAQAVSRFAKFDVLLLSEVPAGEHHLENRLNPLIAQLREESGVDWSYEISEASAPHDSKSPEVHAVIVKTPVRVENVMSISEIDGLCYDWAPLVASVVDPRFKGRVQKVCLTSVHMPPDTAKRRDARDAQVRRLLESYPMQQKLRLNQPFTDKQAKDAKQPPVVHVLAGDFNCCPADDAYDAHRNGWHVEFGAIPTSGGRRAFDNFVVSRSARDHFTIGAEVLTLARPQCSGKGVLGLSDHSPILLTLTEQALPKEAVAARVKKK